MKKLSVFLAGIASPAFAASGLTPSLYNTNFVVLLAFILFVAIILGLKVPGKIGGLLDNRAAQIKADLDEARALREEAQSILALYERKQKDVQAQADRVVAHAKSEAEAAAEQAKVDLQKAIERRLAAAEDQIASAEAAVVRDVRDRAVAVAVAAAGDLIAKQMDAAAANAMIEDSIAQVQARLN